jgi:hypothetical protein
MDIEKFIVERPYLYHLTSKSNAELIIEKKMIYSTNELVRLSNDKAHVPMQRAKRVDHYTLTVDGKVYSLRDQQPISEKALAKSLTHQWTVGDFLYHLNDRVFMWPTLDRLWRHFNRYKDEGPVIFRFPTKELLSINPHVLFCRLNSGATRANTHWGGRPPDRGPDTFLPAEAFGFAIRDVAEVTFPQSCDINVPFSYSDGPDSSYENVE